MSNERIIDGIKIPLSCARKHQYVDTEKRPTMYLGQVPVCVVEDLDSRGQLFVSAPDWSLHLCSTIADVVLRRKPYPIPKPKPYPINRKFACRKCGSRITTDHSRVKAGYWGYCSNCDEDLEHDEVNNAEEETK